MHLVLVEIAVVPDLDEWHGIGFRMNKTLEGGERQPRLDAKCQEFQT